jgi:hypothetical protein
MIRCWQIEAFNNEEEAFGWNTTQYPQRQTILNTLKPYCNLYEMTVEFQNKHRLVSLIFIFVSIGVQHPNIVLLKCLHGTQLLPLQILHLIMLNYNLIYRCTTGMGKLFQPSDMIGL